MPTPPDPGQTSLSSPPRQAIEKAAHYLTVIQGVTIARAVRLTWQPTVLGREPSRPFHLPDGDVSRSHCDVRVVGNDVLVRDLGSTNGTFVDGVRLTDEQILPVSSRLQVGQHTFRHDLLSPEEVERHEEFAKDLERARSYVEALIPAPLDHGPVRTAWCFVPSSVLGGDALGYHEIEGGLLALYLLDVCGHGVGSAMHSASILNVLRARTLPDTDFHQPSRVLESLNAAFPMENHNEMFFTMFYAVLDPTTGRLRYSSAGHPPAILLGADRRIRSRLALRNPAIGIMPGPSFVQAETELRPGERLYVFSDGAFEFQGRDGRERGLEDFERELVEGASPDAMSEPRRLHDSARSASGLELLSDDFTLLVVEKTSSM